MPELADGESVEIQGSAAKPYLLKNTGGVYSCSCPAWRNQSIAIEQRTCKHLRKYRGDAAETERIGSALPQKPVRKSAKDRRINNCRSDGLSWPSRPGQERPGLHFNSRHLLMCRS